MHARNTIHSHKQLDVEVARFSALKLRSLRNRTTIRNNLTVSRSVTLPSIESNRKSMARRMIYDTILALYRVLIRKKAGILLIFVAADFIIVAFRKTCCRAKWEIRAPVASADLCKDNI